MRFLVSVLSCVLLSTLAAQAQSTVPMTPPLPAPSPGTYVRQTSTIIPIMQITVQGRGLLRVPADGLRIDAYVNGIADLVEQDTILARLRSGGLESAQILSPAYFGNQNAQTIVRALLRKPTAPRVEALGKLAASILAERPALKLQSGTLTPFLDDCDGAENKLRRAAIDDARRRAGEIAQASGLILGQITSVNELVAPYCPSGAPAPANFNGANGNAGLEREPAVYLTLNENVTFAISH